MYIETSIIIGYCVIVLLFIYCVTLWVSHPQESPISHDIHFLLLSIHRRTDTSVLLLFFLKMSKKKNVLSLHHCFIPNIDSVLLGTTKCDPIQLCCNKLLYKLINFLLDGVRCMMVIFDIVIEVLITVNNVCVNMEGLQFRYTSKFDNKTQANYHLSNKHLL